MSKEIMDIYFSLFNIHDSDHEYAKERLTKFKVSEEKLGEFDALMENGIMGMFDKKPDNADFLYAYLVWESVNKRTGALNFAT